MSKILLLLLLALATVHAGAQVDSTKIKAAVKDTSGTQQLTETLILMRRADSTRIADSLQKEMLRKQIEELKSYEVGKRKELEAQLNDLSEQDSVRKVRMKAEIDSLKKTAKGYAIVPYKDTIFLVFTKVGTLSPYERAEIVNNRIKELYREYMPKIDSLSITDYGQTVDVVFRDKTIISITELDAMWLNKTKLAIANEHKAAILRDYAYYKENTSMFELLRQIGLTVLVIVLQIILIRLINLLFRRKIDSFLEKQKGERFSGLKIKNYQFLDAEKQTNVALFVSKVLRWFINVVQLYITLPLIFSIFPPTQRLAETLFGYVLSPLKSIGVAVLAYVPNLFTIMVIVVITRYFSRMLKYFADEIEVGNLTIPGFYPDWAKPTFNIVRFLVQAFMFVMIFPYLPGSDSDIFKGVSVFIGIVFSLGSSSVIGNMVAGIVMTYMRPFQIGDRIKIGDVVGDVVEKTPFVTRVKTPKKEYITIPNSNILASNVVNYSTSKLEGIILHSTVTIGYDVPWRLVHETLIAAAKVTENIMHTPEPFVLQTSLDDFYVSYQLNAYSDMPHRQPITYSHLHQNIQDKFNEAGIEILSPHYRAARDGNQTTIPANYLPDDYVAPAFKVKNE